MFDPVEILDVACKNCTQCSHTMASCFQLEHHVQQNHQNVYAAELFHDIVEPEQFLCICCGYKTYYQLELYEHYKQAHNPRTKDNVGYSCDYCRYKTDSCLWLVRHRYLCEKASSSGGQWDSTENARGATSPDLNWADARTSKDVGAMESNVSYLKSFNEKIHLFECNHCSYRAKRKSHLESHMLKHVTNEETNWFHCNYCSHRTKYKSNLKIHMLKHAKNEEINWFRCNNCPYQSKQKSALHTHMLQHARKEEINWFQCNICSYRAKVKSKWKAHRLRHATDEEVDWFQCGHCSYRGKQKGYLKKHYMSKHASTEEINWFRCIQCSYQTKYKSHLKRHMSNIHLC